MIQKNYDYGFEMPAANNTYKYGVNFGIFIYRLKEDVSNPYAGNKNIT